MGKGFRGGPCAIYKNKVSILVFFSTIPWIDKGTKLVLRAIIVENLGLHFKQMTPSRPLKSFPLQYF